MDLSGPCFSSDFDGFRWRPGLGRLGQVVVTGGGGPDLGPQLDSHLDPQILNPCPKP